jgi:ankyrin repeat protein
MEVREGSKKKLYIKLYDACFLKNNYVLDSTLEEHSKKEIDEIININDYDKNKNTLLHIACNNRNFYAAEKLLNYNVDVNKVDEKKMPPLVSAIYNTSTSMIIDLLIKNGADVNFKCPKEGLLPGYTPIIMACACSLSGGIISNLLKNGAKKTINEKAIDGFTALHWACLKDKTKIIEILLKNGSLKSLNILNNQRKNPRDLLYSGLRQAHKKAHDFSRGMNCAPKV